LPYLYFTIAEGEIKLNYHKKHTSEFLTLLIDIKGAIECGQCCVVITEEGSAVVITLTATFTDIRVDRAQITSLPSVLREHPSKLARTLSAHLFVLEDEVRWFENTDIYYLAREENSKYTNSEFLASVLGIGEYVFVGCG
jgi:hypothetical protein